MNEWKDYLKLVKDNGFEKLSKQSATLDIIGNITSLRYNFNQVQLENKNKLPLWFVTSLLNNVAKVAIQQGWDIVFPEEPVEAESADDLAMEAISGVLKLKESSLQKVLDYCVYIMQEMSLSPHTVFNRAMRSVLYHSADE